MHGKCMPTVFHSVLQCSSHCIFSNMAYYTWKFLFANLIIETFNLPWETNEAELYFVVFRRHCCFLFGELLALVLWIALSLMRQRTMTARSGLPGLLRATRPLHGTERLLWRKWVMRTSLLKPGKNNADKGPSIQAAWRSNNCDCLLEACLVPGTSLGIAINLITLQNMKNYLHCIEEETNTVA